MLLPFGLLGNSSGRESRRVLDSLQLPCLCLFIGLKAVMTTVRLCEVFCYSTRDRRRLQNQELQPC